MSQDKLTVLAIEDDPADAQLLRRHLEEIPGQSIDFRTATDSAAGLAELSAHPVDVVFLDYLLPRKTGLEVLEEIQNAGHDCPVVFITGHGAEHVAAAAMRAGAVDYLAKSWLSAESLSQALSNAADARTLLRDEQRYVESLERTNRTLSSFHHTVSNEIRQPLTTVRQFLGLALAGLGGELTDAQQRYLEIAKRACDQTIVCANDLLDVSRLQTGKFTIHPREAPIARVIHQVLSSVIYAAKDRGIHLRNLVQRDLPDVVIDELRIAQVLVNMLHNALKFTPRGGTIAVRAHHPEGHPYFVTVSVSDTGRGIKKTHLENIFEPFREPHDRDPQSEGGLGLGLHVSREIVRLHGGEMWVSSRWGRGSTFSFSLPTTAHRTGARAVWN